jgi:hypothetical protein
MIPIINLNNVVEKELELEHQSLRRARRWISDANQNVYESWYPTNANRISEYNNLEKVSWASQIKSRWGEAYGSILARLANVLNTRREPVSSKS